MRDVWQVALLLMEGLQKSGLKQVSHSGTVGFPWVFEEKVEEQEMPAFHFQAVETLRIGHVLNSEMHQNSAFPCLPHA